MASVRLGSIVADIRGLVGDEIYSRNRGGIYVRSRPDWVQPDTQDQLDARNSLTLAAQAWSGLLNDTKRTSWRRYAKQYLVPDAWGNPRALSGFNRFVQHVVMHHREHGGFGYQTAPSGPPLKPPTFTITADATSGNIHLDMTSLNYDPPAVGMELFAFVSASKSAGVNFYNAPWRYRGALSSNIPPFVNTSDEAPAVGHYTLDGWLYGVQMLKHDTAAWYLMWNLSDWLLSDDPWNWAASNYFTADQAGMYGTYTATLGVVGTAAILDQPWLYDPWDLAPIDAPAAGNHLWLQLVIQDECTGQISSKGRATCTATA